MSLPNPLKLGLKLQIVMDEISYPSPVIALGSAHIVNRAMVNEGGTVLLMRTWDKIFGLEVRCCSTTR